MIEDPDDPQYRYPMTGERLWHRWGCWVVVAEEQDPSDEIVGSVRVVVDSTGGVEGGGRPLEVGYVSVVKLKSLYEPDEMPTGDEFIKRYALPELKTWAGP